MKRLLTTLFISGLMITQAFAGEVIRVKVKGMVCPFCAQGIEKKLKEIKSIESVHVALKQHLVTVTPKEGQTVTDKEIEECILDAGYNVDKIERQKTK